MLWLEKKQKKPFNRGIVTSNQIVEFYNGKSLRINEARRHNFLCCAWRCKGNSRRDISDPQFGRFLDIKYGADKLIIIG